MATATAQQQWSDAHIHPSNSVSSRVYAVIRLHREAVAARSPEEWITLILPPGPLATDLADGYPGPLLTTPTEAFWGTPMSVILDVDPL